MTNEQDASTWRRWFTLSVGQFVVAGYVLMAYGIGRIVRATSALDTSVQQQTANAELASRRLDHQTGRLVDWTRLLAAVTVLLLLTTVVILVVTISPLLGPTGTAATLASVGSSARLSVGDDACTWAARVSSIITIIGLAALFIQLRQLARRTKLKVGFHKDPGGTGRRLMEVVDSTRLPVHWRLGAALSDPFKVAVIVVNESSASASARDIAFEVRYPLWIVPEGDNQLKEPPGIDALCDLRKDIDLNPGATYYIRGTFRAPKGRNRLQVLVIASMRDAKPIDKMLEIELAET